MQTIPAPTHPDVAEWRTPTPADIDAIHAAQVRADAIDHPTYTTTRGDIADFFSLSHIDPARDLVSAWDDDGALIAFGSATEHPQEDASATESPRLQAYVGGFVRPESRRRGIGAVLLAWEVARAEEHVREAQPAGGGLPGEIHLASEETNLDEGAIAERAGFALERWFTVMHRDLHAPIGEGAPDAPLTLAPLRDDLVDAARIARNDAFRDHWGSLQTNPERWASLVGGDVFRADLSRVVVDEDGTVAAFCLVSVNRDDWKALGRPNGYIEYVGVARAYRGRRLAPVVIQATLRAMADDGLEIAVLDVDSESPTGAHTLYERLGFTAEERSRAYVRHV